MRRPGEGLPVGQGLSKGETLDGNDLRQAFEVATRCLEKHRHSINALNVFPVPDGDTGTNMLLTMRSVNEQSSQTPGSSAGAVTAAMAQGALLGARGNSGVILSQFFSGLAQGLRGKDEFNGDDLAQALELASAAAYSSVSEPVDGTMLTVIAELSLAASRYVGRPGSSRDVLSVWRVALEAANEALSRTPLLLPVLREAGVVDAGGQGVVTLLEGACRHLAGENLDDTELELCVPLGLDTSTGEVSLIGSSGLPSVQEEYLAATEDELYGYCTLFLIQGEGLDLNGIREHLTGLAHSTVVVGNESMVKVHVHADDPGPVISYGVSLGSVGQVNIDNIDQQHREFAALHRGQHPTAAAVSDDDTSPVLSGQMAQRSPDSEEVATAVVAVAWGEGFIRLFKGLGCATVVSGGQTMNPSTRELLDAARGTGAMEVILLPNNPNIVPAARQAAALAEAPSGQFSVENGEDAEKMKLHVIPSQSIPQGVAALLLFNPEGDPDLELMEKALATVKTVEVTTAVRSVTLEGLTVEEGQYIGLLEGELVAAGDSAYSALEQALVKGEPAEGQLVTLYWGADVQEDEASNAADELRACIPGVEVEVVYGGQPYYHYIASLE